MDCLIHFKNGTDAYLAHHGVKGMKWGVWNEETKQKKLGSHSSKREVKRAIKESRKAYNKETGKTGLAAMGAKNIGRETEKVSQAHKKALREDEALAKSNKKLDKLSKKAEEAAEQETLAKAAYDMYSVSDPYHISNQARAADRAYAKAKASRYDLDEKYAKAESENDAHRERIAKQFRSKYEDAAAKDLGFKDVEEGKRILRKYNLMGKATGGSAFAGGLRYEDENR